MSSYAACSKVTRVPERLNRLSPTPIQKFQAPARQIKLALKNLNRSAFAFPDWALGYDLKVRVRHWAKFFDAAG